MLQLFSLTFKFTSVRIRAEGGAGKSRQIHRNLRVGGREETAGRRPGGWTGLVSSTGEFLG